MTLLSRSRLLLIVVLSSMLIDDSLAQEPPYDVFPPAAPPYYRVRFEASKEAGKLIFPVKYTIWIPEGIETLRGIVVHQHGCGEGSCSSGLTGAYDLHWQALAKKHGCALLSPSYEQPQNADCQMWCDPRNGSAESFDRALVELGELSGHRELASVPLALWGHSGGGHWCGGIVLTQPERVAAAWLRSGVPLFDSNPERPSIKPHKLPAAALEIPIMCNLGTKEGVTLKDGRFAKVWPANLAFFEKVRGGGGLLGVAIDPLTAHECGNSRYLAIPWLDKVLAMRLPTQPGQALRKVDRKEDWLAEPTELVAHPAERFAGDPLAAGWLPGKQIATAWMQFRKDTNVVDTTPPPAPTRVTIDGERLSWIAEADLESGIEKFRILRNGNLLAEVSGSSKNRYGRQLFQNLQYSDTPTQPLAKMEYVDVSATPRVKTSYAVITVNTAGLASTATPALPAK